MTAQMTKDSNGLWTATLGPLEPNAYTYQFSLDGLKIADLGKPYALTTAARR